MFFRSTIAKLLLTSLLAIFLVVPTPARAQSVASVASSVCSFVMGGPQGLINAVQGAFGGNVSVPGFAGGSISVPGFGGAMVPVNDAANIAQNSIIASQTSSLVKKEGCLDALMKQVVKSIIKDITKSTVDWINTGFEGSPLYVQDPGVFIYSISDAQFGGFMDDYNTLIPDEHPFKNVVARALVDAQNDVFDPQYTLDEATGGPQNTRDFLEGDFSKGGWDAWYELTQNPANNPYGLALESQEEVNRRINRAITEEFTLLDWGDGFRSIRECREYNSDGNCVEYGDIITPGQVVESQLEQVLGTDIRQLELADEINEILGALTGQLIAEVTSPLGLLGSTGDGSSGLGFSTNQFDAEFNPAPTTESSLDFSNNTAVANSVNIAVGQGSFTKQSSTRGNSFSADRAVDGGLDTRFSRSQTGLENDPWWEIDLRRPTAIAFLRLLTFNNGGSFVDKVRVVVSDGSSDPNPFVSGEFSVPSGSGTVTVPLSQTGRYVRIEGITQGLGRQYLSFREIEVYNDTPPVITLSGANPQTLDFGSRYIEQGAAAFDDADQEVHGSGATQVTIDSSDVNPNLPGTYTVIYRATDQSGLEAVKTRTVRVVE